MTDAKKEERAIECMMHALEDTQQNIRSFDTKSEILGILLTLAIGITNFELIKEYKGLSKYILQLSWICTCEYFGYAIYSRKLQIAQSQTFGIRIVKLSLRRSF